MRDVEQALKWSKENITDEEDFKFIEVKSILGESASIDLQIDTMIRAFQFGYYVGAHSKNKNNQKG